MNTWCRSARPAPAQAIGKLAPVVTALQQAGFVVDCTLEGLMHAPETPEILKAGARIMVISNEHPEALERMRPDPALEKQVRNAARMLRGAKRMKVTSDAGTDLDVDMDGAQTVGIWGWTEKPGTLAHWPGGIVVSFPEGEIGQRHAWCSIAATSTSPSSAIWTSRSGSTLKDDYVTDIIGEGTDAEMMRRTISPHGATARPMRSRMSASA